MTISKFFTLTTLLFAAFTFGSCSNDDDDDENENGKDVVVVNHEYVDLGLPSGTLWATCNIGASKPEEYGDYFAWGETIPKETYSIDGSNYKWFDSAKNTITKYCTKSKYGVVDNKTELDPEDDAATANWGSSWRMPSLEQIVELYSIDNTSVEWTTLNGVNGMLITSNKNGNSIFLPHAGFRYDTSSDDVGVRGFYWSRSLHAEDSGPIHNQFSLNIVGWSAWGPFYGFSVRPVRAKK